MLTKDDIKLLNEAINVKRQSLRRAENTQTNEEIREIISRDIQKHNNLEAKLNTKGIFEETQPTKK